MAGAFDKAAAAHKNVAVFFYSPESETAKTVEKNLFSDPEFFTKYSDVVWAKVNVSQDPQAMTKFSFFKVPVIIMFGPDQKELKRFEGATTKESFALGYTTIK